MIINNTLFNCELIEILTELQNQLKINDIPLLQTLKDSNSDIMVQCPFHKNGTEKKPSAGIRKSDGQFHCFRGSTKVITREFGAVEMSKITGIPVHIINGLGEWESVVFNNYGKQPLMKLTLSCNTKEKVIYATPEHEWVLKKRAQKKKTLELKPNTYLEKIMPKKLSNVKIDPMGIRHGFCYGDGNCYGHNKSNTVFYNRCYFYNDLDTELKQYFNGCKFSSGLAGNDKEYEYVLFKSNRNYKNVPELNEPVEYLLGFLAGYFVADGNCFNNRLSICSYKYEDLYKIQQICNVLGIVTTEIGIGRIKSGKRGCVFVKQDTECYWLRIVANTVPHEFFISDKGREAKQRYTGRNCYRVINVEPTDIIEDVYCCQTSTHSFALEHFILTGNCFTCNTTKSLQEVISYCLGYTTDYLGINGWKWLQKNFLSLSTLDRKPIALELSRNFQKNNIQYVGEDELDKYRYIHPYMYKRKLTNEIIEMFDIGYDVDSQCLTFPVRDISGNCLFIARRSVNSKWFSYPNHSKKSLYGIYEISKLEKLPKEIIVTESMTDCLTCWVYDKVAVALNGLGSSTQYRELEQLPCRTLILATDDDEAGRKARKRIKENVKNKLIMEYKTYNGKKDINELTKEEFDKLEVVL